MHPNRQPFKAKRAAPIDRGITSLVRQRPIFKTSGDFRIFDSTSRRKSPAISTKGRRRPGGRVDTVARACRLASFYSLMRLARQAASSPNDGLTY
jgi:hypothetical protein